MGAHPYHRKLERVLSRMGGMYTLNDILSLIARNEMQSFVEGDSWAITRVALFPRDHGRRAAAFGLGEDRSCRMICPINARSIDREPSR